MSELVIRSGGVVEVDTASLRAVAVELDGIAGEAEDIRSDVDVATTRLSEVGHETLPVQWMVAGLVSSVARAGADAADLATLVRRAADQYEAVDLLVQREFAEARGDEAALRRIDRALDVLPVPAREAAERSLDAAPHVEALANQALWTSILLGSPLGLLTPHLVRGLAGMVDIAGRGRIASGERLSGSPVPVDVRRVPAPRTASPPTTFAEAAARIPGGGATRVRVERYAMPSGGVQFAVYIAGTQSFGGDDAFDAASNVELYRGGHSASYDATTAALAQAGAQPGDVVHAFGHSQGAMIAERLAIDSLYDVETVGSFGSPVQADVPDGTIAVSVRHTDDPVVALQGGGHANGVGAPGSFVVERLADPLPGIRDLTIPAHQMHAYVETAGMIDASDDPRIDVVRSTFAELGRAEAVEVTEYSATRVSPSTSAAG